MLDQIYVWLNDRMAGREFTSLIPDHIQPPLDANKATMEKYR